MKRAFWVLGCWVLGAGSAYAQAPIRTVDFPTALREAVEKNPTI